MRRSVYFTTSFSVCSLRRTKFPITTPTFGSTTKLQHIRAKCRRSGWPFYGIELRACLKSHVLAASRLVINWIMAIRIHASVVSGKASKSLLNRRERLSQPKVRSTIQRHCRTRNPWLFRGRFTIERARCKTVATHSTSLPA